MCKHVGMEGSVKFPNECMAQRRINSVFFLIANGTTRSPRVIYGLTNHKRAMRIFQLPICFSDQNCAGCRNTTELWAVVGPKLALSQKRTPSLSGF